jgi:thermitase
VYPSPRSLSGPRRPFTLAVVTAALFSLLATTMPTVAAAAPPQQDTDDTTRLIIKYREGTSPAAARAVERAARAAHVRRIDRLGASVVEVPQGRAAAALRALAADREVAFVEVDGTVEGAELLPNDPLYDRQWGLPQIGAPAAWTVGTGSDVAVAVLDTGVDRDHPDLEGAVLPGWNAITGGNDTSDPHGHGTSVAGIIAARGDNGQGIAGVCWGCEILPVTVLDADNRGSLADVAAGIVFAVDRGAQVINMSLGSANPSRLLEEAVAYAHGEGVVLIASAGNSGSDELRYPAALDGVVGVAATNARDERYSWSSFGDWVDVEAPGCAMTTAVDEYGLFCGTSASAPFAAGVAGLILSSGLAEGGRAAVEQLQGTAHAFSGASRWGRIDAARAVLPALEVEPPPAVDDDPASDEEVGGEPPHDAAEPANPLGTWSFNLNPRNPAASVEVVPPASSEVRFVLTGRGNHPVALRVTLDGGRVVEAEGRQGVELVVTGSGGPVSVEVTGQGRLGLDAVMSG